MCRTNLIKIIPIILPFVINIVDVVPNPVIPGTFTVHYDIVFTLVSPPPTITFLLAFNIEFTPAAVAGIIFGDTYHGGASTTWLQPSFVDATANGLYLGRQYFQPRIGGT